MLVYLINVLHWNGFVVSQLFIFNLSAVTLLEHLVDNIEAFGGDPSRITLFGQSAGGASVDYYAYAWTKDPIVNGIILQSGTTSTMSFGDSSSSNEAWYKASKALGCGGKDAGEKTLRCLRGKSTQEILDATKPVLGGNTINLGGFLPKPDGNTVFTTAEYKEKLAAGDFIKKVIAPFLILKGITFNSLIASSHW
jgi:cholinesterase